VGNLVKLIDKSNGYIFSSIDSSAIEFSKIAAGPVDWDYNRYPFSRSSCKYCMFIYLHVLCKDKR
jgi:GPN-loop GTPase